MRGGAATAHGVPRGRRAVITLAVIGLWCPVPCEVADRASAPRPAYVAPEPGDAAAGAEYATDRPAPPSDSGGRAAQRSIVSHRITVDLSRRDTHWTIPLQPSDTLRITDLEVDSLPMEYRLEPKQGIVRPGEPVEIILVPFTAVRIRLSLITRDGAPVLKVSPRIELDRGEPMDFTRDRVERAIRSFDRQVRDFSRQASTISRERASLEDWLRSPGNKSLDRVKVVRSQLKSLDQTIVVCQRKLLAAQAARHSLRQIEHLVDQIHDTAEIHFTARSDGGS